MRKIFLILTLFISFVSFGQDFYRGESKIGQFIFYYGQYGVPTNYQYRVVRERSIAAMVDSSLHVPRYNGTPSGLRTGSSTNDGLIAVDTTNNIFYIYSSGTWIALTGDNIYNSDGILDANRTLTGLNNTYGLNFDSVNYFKVRRNNVLRLDISNSISKLSSIAGDSYVYATTGEAGLWNDNSNMVVHNDDSIIFNNAVGVYQFRHIPYNSGSDMVSLVLDTTNGRLYRKTITGGAGTINSGTTGKPAYYVGATTLDDFAAVDYATSGDLVKITHQNTTDNGVLLQGIGSQTGNFITAKNSGATTVFELTEDGYLNLPGDNYPAEIIKFGTGDGYITTTTTNGIAMVLPATGEGGAFTSAGSKIFAYNSNGLTRFGGGSISNNYMVEVAGSFNVSGKSLFGATTPTTPTALVHLAAGTATANTAPIKLTTGTALGTPEDGAIEYHSSHIYGTIGSTRTRLDNGIQSKGMTLESPGAAESFGMWQTQTDITVSSIKAVVIGSSPSVTINIAFGTDRTSGTNVFSAGTAITNTTTGQTINSGFNDATIPAGSFIWFTSSAQSGTVTQIEVTINYTED